MKPVLSVILPAIRTNLWDKFYDSLARSCSRYSWEVIFSSPFELTPYLQLKNNVKLVRDFGCPSRAAQLALFEAEGKYVYHTVDDGIFFDGAIDNAIDWHAHMGNVDKFVINMRYREGVNYQGTELPSEYWNAWHHKDLRLQGIPKNYQATCHFLIDSDYMFNLGGFDCRFEYLVHPCLDLMFRIQNDGGSIIDSPMEIISCDHMPGHSGDHAPIHDAQQIHDYPIFKAMYENEIFPKRIRIDLNNWSQQPSIWKRRFNKIPREYKDLLND